MLLLLSVLVALLISFGSCAKATIIHNHQAQYTIPQPSIQVLREGGLRVSIPHTAGIQLFAFHGNINKRIDGVAAGQIARDVVGKTEDQWIFQDCTLKLEPHDRVYYWLFVIKDNLGYRYHDGEYEVKETDLNGDDCQPKSIEIESKIRGDECQCDSLILNLTESLIKLRNERNAFRDKSEILQELLEQIPDVRTSLVLTGHTPQEWEPLQAVREIVKQKLRLSIQIISAVRINDNTINFNVSTLEDKIVIIQAAKEKLKQSRIKITY